MGILVRELSALYQAGLQGNPSPLPALPIQYADYAIWQRQHFQGGETRRDSALRLSGDKPQPLHHVPTTPNLEGQLAYWRRQLDGVPPLLELPTDHPRPAVQTDAGAKLSLLLSLTLLQELKRVSHREGATLFMTLLATFQILLMRYSGKHDIVVGTPIADRGQAGLEDLIGFFVNMLVLRSDLSGNPSFRQLLARVREVALQAYEHQDLPFEKLVESRLAPEQRSLSYSPLFQMLFALQNVPSPDITLPDLTFRQLENEHFTTLFDLSLVVTEEERGLLVEVEYSTDLFDATTIARLLSHWQVLLEAIVRDPEQAIETLPLLTDAEREQILAQGVGRGLAPLRDGPLRYVPPNGGAQDPSLHDPQTLWQGIMEGRKIPPYEEIPLDFVGVGAQGISRSPIPPQVYLCVHQLFELQVERMPDVVALTFGKDEELTYAELNKRANQLAHYLQSLGVGPEVLVGIALVRSIEMIVVLLGVLKAGGAYVPLDPTYPSERIAFVIQDTHVQVLLTQQRLSGQIPASVAHLLVLEQVWETVIAQSAQNAQSQVEASNLAYIIYTSGSTGVPKGVQVTHRGLSNLGLTQADTFAIGPGSRVLQFASLNFDASIWEILMALLVGGSLHLERIERMLPGPDLLQVLQEQAITSVTLPPSALAMLPTSASLPALQTLVVAGEACPVGLMARWAPGRHFFNAYGPTEATVCASMALCSVDQANQDVLSLGRPLTNTQFYVLDQHLQPVPLGVSGEIYLGGVNLAQGYLHQPEATAWRFVPNPFADPCSDLGARLYRTGDLARYRPDGTVEYLGRVDQQVKLRGFRIELGEIEAVLRAYPAVQEAVVVLQEEGQGRQYLVAYVVARAETVGAGLAPALQGHLRKHLPDYMVPTFVIFLETLPLNPNGKVDRKALPVLDRSQLPESTEMVAPQTPLQEQLAVIWAELLNLPQVGTQHNFFELGGHSLLATQLVARVRTLFQVEIPLRRLFETPTIADLALAIEQTQSEQIEQAESEKLVQMFPALGELSEGEIQAIFAD
jgi:amino acid adenylation domain-containing protein